MPPFARLTLAATLILGFRSPAHAADPKPVDPDRLRPGLVATFRDAAKPTPQQITRLEPTVALNWAAGEAPHPRLAADAGSVRWEGYLNLLRAGEYRFSATFRGKFRLTLVGKEVLAAESNEAEPARAEGTAVKLEAGVLPFVAEFTRPTGPARLELFWQGPSFRREPLPFDRLGHLPTAAADRLQADALAEHGRFLAEERACLNCHRPAAADRLGRGVQARLGPDLSRVGQRAYAGWIDRWLADPAKFRPGTSMPRMFDDDPDGRAERYAVTSYLVALGGPLKPESKPPKPKDATASIARGQALFTSTGCIACHGAGVRSQESGVREDIVSFYGLLAETGAKANYPLGALGSKTRPDQLTAFLLNPLATNPSGRMPNMTLQGKEAEDLARFLCQTRDAALDTAIPDAPPADALPTLGKQLIDKAADLAAFQKLSAEVQWREAGRRLVTVKGCVNCHTLTQPGTPALRQEPAKLDLAGIRKSDPTRGCLAEKRPAHSGAPFYGFSKRERECLTAFLTHGLDGAGSPAPTHAGRVAFKRFNCLNCHQRDGEGGFSAEQVEQLRRFEKADNAEGVLPPTLTGVGHKLRTPWAKQVLASGGRARPWMSLRMPQYGEPNVGFLAETLATLEGAAPEADIHSIKLTGERLSAGRVLTGKSGFSCISCHDIAGIANSGTRGPDLASTTQRVRFDWYRRWLEQPQRMVPGTRMPQVFTDGKSLLTDILGGRADDQAEAMWAYYTLGPNLPLPDGLEPPKGLLVSVKDRPELLRTFLPEAGSRAIAVGYPGGVSAAFDAATGRLAYAWSGNFLDASPVWTNRGGAPAKLLGSRFWDAPAGNPWALTPGSEPPDFAARAKDPAYGGPVPEGQVFHGKRLVHFDGYRLDAGGLPTFRYRVGAGVGTDLTLAVEEKPEPMRSPVAAGLKRQFTVRPPAGQVTWLLAGEATHVPKLYATDGTPVADNGSEPAASTDRLLVLPQDGGRAVILGLSAVPKGAVWHWQEVPGGRKRVLLKLPAASADAKPVEVGLQVWALARFEPELLVVLRAKSK